MGERTHYTPGTFNWVDLSTTDQDAAKGFYRELFGWEFTDLPAGEGFVYSMAALNGKWVGAISPQPQQQRDAGVGPAWNSYIAVADIEDAAARATELGATVHGDPFDVFQAGRMAVVQDPQGAWFQLWEARDHIGAGLVNAPGALSWNELGSPDMEGSARFYVDLFGWTATPMEAGEVPYLVIRTADGHTNGGIRPPAPPGAPAFWLVYFATANLEAAVDRVSALAGRVLMEPTDIGVARIAVVHDPQGAVFALYDGTLDE